MAKDRALERVMQIIEERGSISRTKHTDEQLEKDIARAKNLGYIQQKLSLKTGLPGHSYEFTERGQRLVDSGYNFSVVDDKNSFNINGTNVHVGNNSGNYSQGNPKKSDGNILSRILIGVLIAVLAGLILYFIIGQIV